MRTIRVRELHNWPPTVGGAHASGSVFPQGGEGRVDNVLSVDGSEVIFSGEFGGHVPTYHFFAADEKIAKKVRALIAENLGKTVAELGELEIEVEMKTAGAH
ncbi:MAG TPA: hypothetical protein VIH72_09235 [Candidatus Acidoferrales bacterium]